MIRLLTLITLGGGVANVYGPPVKANTTLTCPAGASQTSSFDYDASLALHQCVRENNEQLGPTELKAFNGKVVATMTVDERGAASCQLSAGAKLGKFLATFARCGAHDAGR